MSHWNYRVVEFVDTDGSDYLEIKEVFYGDDGKPRAFGDAALRWTPEDGPAEMLANMGKALTKPTIKRNDFPDGGKE
jgi:hypothetical protein